MVADFISLKATNTEAGFLTCLERTGQLSSLPSDSFEGLFRRAWSGQGCRTAPPVAGGSNVVCLCLRLGRVSCPVNYGESKCVCAVQVLADGVAGDPESTRTEPKMFKT